MPGHPESPARLESLLAALAAPAFAGLVRSEAPEATREELGRVHELAYIDAVLAAVPLRGMVELDPDTALTPGSGRAALRAAGAVVMAVDAVAGGSVANAFCAVRPPGHHAERGRPMGFCIFNNVAVGALHGRAVHGLERVAILDFDVHHGNGSQNVCAPDSGLFYGSTHQNPAYPGTGRAHETGVAGNVVNVPLLPGTGGAKFRNAWAEQILPALDAFAPDLVMVSAGFDGHRDDPLASLLLEEADFAWVTKAIGAVAERHARGRLISVLEGGYDEDALAASVQAHVAELMLLRQG